MCDAPGSAARRLVELERQLRPRNVFEKAARAAVLPAATAAGAEKKWNPLCAAEELPMGTIMVDAKAIDLPEGVIFPQFPQMFKDWQERGKPPVMTYNLMGGRRLTVVADPNLFKGIFFPDNINLSSNQEVLAHQWFGIEKELSRAYTAQGLKNTRKALKHGKAKAMNDIVAKGITSAFNSDMFGPSGTADLMTFAKLSFWPVNAALFGEETVNPDVCPKIFEQLDTYNSRFELVANGMPRKMYPEMEQAALDISKHFGDMIGKGYATRESCPVLKARIDAIDPNDTRWSNNDKGRFILSVFWAAQGNTLPGTFWALAMSLADPQVKAKCIAEARSAAFMAQPDAQGKYDIKALPYINAVVQEVLRLKVANITHRKSLRDFCVLPSKTSNSAFRVAKGDMVTVCSYLQHHDERVFQDPYRFLPERWLQSSKVSYNAWIPWGGGAGQCSGRFLAVQEIVTLVALFYRNYDADLLDPVPQEEWQNVVAMVTPKQPFDCRVRYTRRQASDPVL